MASCTHRWNLPGYRARLASLVGDECLYGPEFKVGQLKFQLHLHPKFNRWIEPGALYLRLLTVAGGHDPIQGLKIRTTFRVPELDYVGSCTVKDNLSRWHGGFSPTDPAALNQKLVEYDGDCISVEAFVEILEVDMRSETIFRWPIEQFEDLRAAVSPAGPASPKAGFLVRSARRFDVHNDEFGRFTFRADLHPNIDATGNMYVSFKLEGCGPRVDLLELEYELSLEELGFTTRSALLRGNRQDWSQAFGIAGAPTNCAELRSYKGPLTIRLQVRIHSCAFIEQTKFAPLCSGWVDASNQYLLLSAAGPLVRGEPEPVAEIAEMNGTNFPRASAQNISQMWQYLLENGVPRENVWAANFNGESAQAHPREVIQSFLGKYAGATKLVIYFTGHADAQTGTWYFSWRPEGQQYTADVAVTPKDLFAWWRSVVPVISRIPLEVICETVSAGSWCADAETECLNGRIIAACPPGGQAWVHHDGSVFTNLLIGRGKPTIRRMVVEQVPWEYSLTGIKKELIVNVAEPKGKAFEGTTSPPPSTGYSWQSTSPGSPLSSFRGASPPSTMSSWYRASPESTMSPMR